MAYDELLDEMSAALDQVDLAEDAVSKKRGELADARAQLSAARAKVTEIEGEIRSRVKTGRSTRPLLDAIQSAEEIRASSDIPAKPRRHHKAAEAVGARP